MLNGFHWLLDLGDCRGDAALLTHHAQLRAFCLRACADAGLVTLGDVFHQFQPQGVTGVVLLAESHMAVHTWPELGAVTLDVYVCNFGADNSGRAQALLDDLVQAFAPARVERHRIVRGARTPLAPA